jgi:hypothetical protein
MILSERKINKLLGLPSLDVSRKRRTLSVAWATQHDDHDDQSRLSDQLQDRNEET